MNFIQPVQLLQGIRNHVQLAAKDFLSASDITLIHARLMKLVCLANYCVFYRIDPTHQKINITFHGMLDQKHIDNDTFDYLRSLENEANAGRFYMLHKIHANV